MNIGRRGGRRRHRLETTTETTLAAPAYLTRATPPLELLGEEGLVRIEEAADTILQETGIEFRGDPEALELWRQAGADVEGERVRIPRGLCTSLVQATTPARFTQLARNPARSVEIGGSAVVFAPAYGPPFARGVGIERRYATIEDFRNFVRLTHMSPHLHHSGGTVCEPTDIPVPKRHLDMVDAHIRLTDKPFMGAVTAKDRAEDSLAMTELVFGREAMAENCCILGLININSPLVLDDTMLAAMKVYARAGQATIITPFVIAGASGPTTVAGIVAQAHAETIAGLAFAQLVNPGAPTVYGHLGMGMNMRTGAPVRFDETWRSLVVAGQLARRLGVPFRCGGASSTSKIPDIHAGMEGAIYLQHSLLAGVNLLIHATGTLEGGLCLDYEKYVLDCHMLGALARTIEAIDTSEESLATDAAAEAGPGGNFLSTSHTMDRYRDAFYDSPLFDNTSFEQWSEAGAKDAVAHAHQEVTRLLAEHQPPPLDPAISEALTDFVTRRKAELPDSFA